MPAKKKSVTNKQTKIKAKTLFDHLNAITQIQDSNYFDKITDADKKTWSNFMVNRFLSMNSDWTEIISELDPYTTGNQLSPELTYKVYIDIFPKSKTFLKYIKSKAVPKYNKELIKLIKLHFECSSKEAIEYLNIFYSKDSQMEELKNIISKYGNDEKEIAKLIKL